MSCRVLIVLIAFLSNSCKNATFILKDKSYRANSIYTTYQIMFDLGKDSLLIEKSKPTLDSILSFIVNNPKLRIEIGVHSDFRGDDEQNLKLTQLRAESLKKYFINFINSNRLIAKGYGEKQPLESIKKQDNCGTNHKNINRRVTFKILKLNLRSK